MCNSSNTKKFETKEKIENFPTPIPNFKYNNNNKLNENEYLKTDNNNLTNKNNKNRNINSLSTKNNSYDYDLITKKNNNNKKQNEIKFNNKNNTNFNNENDKKINKNKQTNSNYDKNSNKNIQSSPNQNNKNIKIHKNNENLNNKIEIKKSPNKKNIKIEINEEQNTTIKNNFSNEIEFTLEATLGEIELPVYLKENQTFEIIILNENEKWNFFSDEEPVSFLGYQNLKHNNFNIGCLLYRISSSSKFHNITLKRKKYISDSTGSLLLSANLDLNENDYKPEGKIQLKISGIEKFNNDFYNKIDKLNGFNLTKLNMNEINNEKEINIVRYVNMIRTNSKKFCENYLFYLNEESETKNFLYNFSSLHELNIDLNLSKIAINLAEKIAYDGTTGHINSELKNEIKKYNNENIKSFGKNFLYGINNPLLIICRMINDNKNDSKNRNNILDSKFTHIGVAIRDHLIYKWICVIIFVEK